MDIGLAVLHTTGVTAPGQSFDALWVGSNVVDSTAAILEAIPHPFQAFLQAKLQAGENEPLVDSELTITTAKTIYIFTFVWGGKWKLISADGATIWAKYMKESAPARYLTHSNMSSDSSWNTSLNFSLGTNSTAFSIVGITGYSLS